MFSPRRGSRPIIGSTIGASTATDEQIMRCARNNGCVVLTHDLDFSAILAAGRDGTPSVVQVRSNDVTPEVSGRSVRAGLIQLADELGKGAIVTIDSGRARVRHLPL